MFACTWKCGRRSRRTHTMRMHTGVPVVVCVARKLRPCPSYSGRRDVIILYIGVAYTRGGGYFSTSLARWLKARPLPLGGHPASPAGVFRPATARSEATGAEVHPDAPGGPPPVVVGRGGVARLPAGGPLVAAMAHGAWGPILARTRPQRGGGGLYRPQNGCTEQWVLWAPEILF